MDHEVFDGKHPWHLEKYPDIPNLHIIRHKPGEGLGETLEFKGWFDLNCLTESVIFDQKWVFSSVEPNKEISGAQKNVRPGMFDGSKANFSRQFNF